MKTFKKVFTTGQVAKICKVAPRTVSKWFDSGRLKGYRIPGSMDRRVPRENLIRFLNENDMPLGELEEEELHKVLLVGTSTEFNEAMKKFLPRIHGYKMECAGNGFECGGCLVPFNPDLIVIDFALGRAEAIQIVESIRKMERFTQTHIYAIVYEDEADHERLNDLGITNVFQHPVGPKTIAEFIELNLSREEVAA